VVCSPCRSPRPFTERYTCWHSAGVERLRAAHRRQRSRARSCTRRLRRSRSPSRRAACVKPGAPMTIVLHPSSSDVRRGTADCADRSAELLHADAPQRRRLPSVRSRADDDSPDRRRRDRSPIGSDDEVPREERPSAVTGSPAAASGTDSRRSARRTLRRPPRASSAPDPARFPGVARASGRERPSVRAVRRRHARPRRDERSACRRGTRSPFAQSVRAVLGRYRFSQARSAGEGAHARAAAVRLHAE
jgi:hypothetical protein